MSVIILAGDVGGTKTLLQLSEVSGGSRRVLAERRYASQEHAGLAEIVRIFLSEHAAAASRDFPGDHAAAAPRSAGGFVTSACFGVPGPVKHGRSRPTNLPWTVDERELQSGLGIPRVRLINDFVAIAHGIRQLAADDLVTLNPGQADPRGPIAVLGAGTGLGEAILYWVGSGYEVLPSEGGHTDFAPRDDPEVGLLRWLQQRHGHVSWERVLSGPGLVSIYQYLRDAGIAPESPAARQAMAEGDAAAAVSAHAGSDPLCARTVQTFCSLYGAEAANLALKILATGGVYVAGGVATHLVQYLQDGRFSRAFVEKGRMSSLLEGIPVYLVINPKVGLIGAAVAAARNR